VHVRGVEDFLLFFSKSVMGGGGHVNVTSGHVTHRPPLKRSDRHDVLLARRETHALTIRHSICGSGVASSPVMSRHAINEQKQKQKWTGWESHGEPQGQCGRRQRRIRQRRTRLPHSAAGVDEGGAPGGLSSSLRLSAPVDVAVYLSIPDVISTVFCSLMCPSLTALPLATCFR